MSLENQIKLYLERIKRGAIPTGFIDLDNVLSGGFARGGLYCIAASPGMGKTSFALNIAVNISGHEKTPALFVSGEFKVDLFLGKIMAMSTGVPVCELSKGAFNPDVWQIIDDESKKIAALPLDFAEIFGTHINRILNDFSGGVLILDPIESMACPDSILTLLKSWAIKTNSVVIFTKNLSESLEYRQNRRPLMQDLIDTGWAIHTACDGVMFLYRDAVYRPTTKDKNTAEVIVARHRHGPACAVMLHFEQNIAKFSSLSFEPGKGVRV